MTLTAEVVTSVKEKAKKAKHVSKNSVYFRQRKKMTRCLKWQKR